MAKRHSVTLPITTVRQAWGALRIPELPKATKLNLLEFLADSNDVQYARQVMDKDLCEDHPDLQQRFLSILIAARDAWYLAHAFGIETDPNRRAELLALVETRSRAAKFVLLNSISKLSPEEQVRLAPIALRSDETFYWAKMLLEEHSAVAPALQGFLVGFRGVRSNQKRRSSWYAMDILSDSFEKYFPASAPMTAEERGLLIQTILANGYACGEALRNFRRRDLKLTGEEIKLFIAGALMHFSSSDRYFSEEMRIKEFLADEELLKHFSEEQLAQFQELVRPKAA